jgi:hypothetical protein
LEITERALMGTSRRDILSTGKRNQAWFNCSLVK